MIEKWGIQERTRALSRHLSGDRIVAVGREDSKSVVAQKFCASGCVGGVDTSHRGLALGE